MVNDEGALRAQIMRQLAHWKTAVVTIDDADNFAAPEAWARVEQYLGLALRKHLQTTVDQLRLEVNGLTAQVASAQSLPQLQLAAQRLLAFRQRYIAVETTLDFYGDAVNTRTNPKLASILRSLDLIAVRSMESVLRPLGKEIPRVLTYIDKGLGASILRAGVRLWDGGTISPAAAIKVTRHNLYRPTSLIHETGHQVAHILGWTEEFAAALRHALTPHASRDVVEGWMETASEVVADIYAFVHCGYGAVAALHDVVAADPGTVLRYLPGDPHPIPFIRVLLNTEYCRRMFGAGPWDKLASAWRRTYPLERAAAGTRQFLEQSLMLLPRLAELSLLRPMRAFGGRAIVDLVDPASVRPDALAQWSKQLGVALEISPHWALTEPVRLLALSSYQMAVEPERAEEIAKRYEAWTQRLGSLVRAA
jgi:hypothetical protein